MPSVIDTLNRLLGDPSKKELKTIAPIVGEVRILQRSAPIQKLKLADLPAKTQEFRDRYQKGESLDAMLPEAFAVAIRACELLVG
jgi:preprotein translocase subunit SecA